MDISEVAQGLVGLCRNGQFGEAMQKYYADDIVSVEAMGDDPESRGLAAVQAHGEWFASNHEIHSTNVDGPFVNGDQFAVKFTLDATYKVTGQRMTIAEVGVYTVKDGKVVHARFFM